MPERDDDLAAATVEALAATARAAGELAQAQAAQTAATRDLERHVVETKEAAQWAQTHSAGAKSHAQNAAEGIARVGAEVERLHRKVPTPTHVPALRRYAPHAVGFALVFVLGLGLGIALPRSCGSWPVSFADLDAIDPVADEIEPVDGRRRADAGARPPRGAPPPRRAGKPSDTSVDPDELPADSDRAGCVDQAERPNAMQRSRCRW